MGVITIRNLPDETVKSVKIAAATNGRSMEAELRDLIGRTYVSQKKKTVDDVRQLFRDRYNKNMPEEAVDDFLAHRHEDFDD